MWQNLLLLFCLINYSGSPSAAVTGKRRENVSLSCEPQAREITALVLNRLSKNILVCENEKCKSENDRVFKERSCDIIIKDLIYNDAGKYILRVYYNNDQTELERQILEYHLYVHGEISVKKGEDLELDVLLSNAYKVERSSSSGWTELWTRGHGVSSDRLTDRDETLIIHEFTVNDTGTYRVLDYEGETLITVTVTESGKGSKEKLDTEDDHKPNEQSKIWIIVLSVCGALLGLGVVVFVLYKKHQQHDNRNADHDDYQGVPMPERE